MARDHRSFLTWGAFLPCPLSILAALSVLVVVLMGKRHAYQAPERARAGRPDPCHVKRHPDDEYPELSLWEYTGSVRGDVCGGWGSISTPSIELAGNMPHARHPKENSPLSMQLNHEPIGSDD